MERRSDNYMALSTELTMTAGIAVVVNLSRVRKSAGSSWL